MKLYTYGIATKVNFTVEAETEQDADRLAHRQVWLLGGGLDREEFLMQISDGYIISVSDEAVLEDTYEG